VLGRQVKGSDEERFDLLYMDLFQLVKPEIANLLCISLQNLVRIRQQNPKLEDEVYMVFKGKDPTK